MVTLRVDRRWQTQSRVRNGAERRDSDLDCTIGVALDAANVRRAINQLAEHAGSVRDRLLPRALENADDTSFEP